MLFPKKLLIALFIVIIVIIIVVFYINYLRLRLTGTSILGLVEDKPKNIIFKVSGFRNNTTIPTKYTCDGDNVSPEIVIEKVPPEAKSLVLIVYDPDAPHGIFYHWILYNIPASTKVIPENVTREKATRWGLQGINSFGYIGYGGPCPPPGARHRYVFLLMALDKNLDLPPGAPYADVIEDIRDHIIGYGIYVGYYK